jgi:hypothetical protein
VLTFEVVGSPNSRHNLRPRRWVTLTPRKAEDEASGGARLAEGRVAVRVLRAEAELEAGAGLGAPGLSEREEEQGEPSVHFVAAHRRVGAREKLRLPWRWRGGHRGCERRGRGTKGSRDSALRRPRPPGACRRRRRP